MLASKAPRKTTSASYTPYTFASRGPQVLDLAIAFRKLRCRCDALPRVLLDPTGRVRHQRRSSGLSCVALLFVTSEVRVRGEAYP